jgi:predicted amidohydrolase
MEIINNVCIAFFGMFICYDLRNKQTQVASACKENTVSLLLVTKPDAVRLYLWEQELLLLNVFQTIPSAALESMI